MPEDAVRECPPDENSENDDVLRDGPSPGNDADVGGGDNEDSNQLQVKDLNGNDDCDDDCLGGGEFGHAGCRSGWTTADVSTGGRY